MNKIDELMALAWKMRCAKGEVALNAAISELKRELHHTLEAALKPDGEPLSVMAMNDLWNAATNEHGSQVVAFARAIEQAHGITGGKT